MPSAEGCALDVILSASSGERGRSGGDAADGRTVSGAPVLRIAADGGGVAPRRLGGEPQAGAAADAVDWFVGDLSETQHQPAASGAQGVPLSAAGPDHRPAEPSLVRRHHLYSDG